MSKNGRPTKFTQETIDLVLEGIRYGMPYHRAAEAAGITYRTFLRWMERGENAQSGQFRDFYNQVRQAESQGMKENLKRVYESARTDWRAAAWILKVRHPEEFGDKQQIEGNMNHSGNVNVNINIEDADGG